MAKIRVACIVVKNYIISTIFKGDSAKIMEYSMQDIDGNDVRLGDLIAANKVTMLNFWGVGCGPCIEEMPGLERLYQEHKDQGFTIIGITTDIVRSDGSFADDAIDEAKSIRNLFIS